MYQITKDGVLLGVYHSPQWVKVQENGFLGLCRREEAQGVVVGGAVYRLEDQEIPGAETAAAEEISEEEVQKRQQEVLDGKAEKKEVQDLLSAIERGTAL